MENYGCFYGERINSRLIIVIFCDISKIKIKLSTEIKYHIDKSTFKNKQPFYVCLETKEQTGHEQYYFYSNIMGKDGQNYCNIKMFQIPVHVQWCLSLLIYLINILLLLLPLMRTMSQYSND